MPRRAPKGSRSKGVGPSPTPIPNTPAAATSPQEVDDDPVNALDIASLTLDVPIANKPKKERKPKPFRFMDLPRDVRLLVYSHHFANIGPVVDVEPGNYAAIHRRLVIFRVCRLFYEEASHIFYSEKTFRIFPIDGRYARAKKGLLARMKPRVRSHMTTLELRLGPGWSKPYRSWVVDDLVGLKDCVNVHRLAVYIEIDPSDNIFNGWRKSSGFYESFCQNLLRDLLHSLPNVRTVTFDAHDPVKKSGDMARGLIEVAREEQRKIGWGPCRGWTDEDEEEEVPEPAALATGTFFLANSEGWDLTTATAAAAAIPQPVAA